ncbi:MAG TPA: prephenate dehydratase [Vicinamibacteria bacterium]|jgi:prephenate dehydratase|nr:prephenate dehydratase [Vicinamibacteria bacterium]
MGQPMQVAIQGEMGSFSHQAARETLGEEVEIRPCPSFDALFDAVGSGGADRAVVPIENSLTGSIHENYDRLLARSLHIVGETQLRIQQCLIARPGASLGSLRRVASHPVALAQCRNFFAAHPHLEAVAAYDTAGSVQRLLQAGPMTEAAIASRLAATLYHGEVLAEGIEDDPQNFTRFLVLAREPGPIGGAAKTSLAFTLPNVAGSLHRALGAFALRGASLAKIESRPLRGRPWEYAFYLDVLGNPQGRVGEALAELRGLAGEFRILGSYPEGLKKPE